MATIKPVKSIGDLRYLCNNGKLQEDYQKLTKISASNLGGPEGASLDDCFQWLNVNAAETSEEGVVDEINFCVDLV